METSGASEHAAGAPDQGRAEQASELEPDDASSRGSADWNESVADELPDTSERTDHADDHAAILFDDLGATGFALAKSVALLTDV